MGSSVTLKLSRSTVQIGCLGYSQKMGKETRTLSWVLLLFTQFGHAIFPTFHPPQWHIPGASMIGRAWYLSNTFCSFLALVLFSLLNWPRQAPEIQMRAKGFQGGRNEKGRVPSPASEVLTYFSLLIIFGERVRVRTKKVPSK